MRKMRTQHSLLLAWYVACCVLEPFDLAYLDACLMWQCGKYRCCPCEHSYSAAEHHIAAPPGFADTSLPSTTSRSTYSLDSSSYRRVRPQRRRRALLPTPRHTSVRQPQRYFAADHHIACTYSPGGFGLFLPFPTKECLRTHHAILRYGNHSDTSQPSTTSQHLLPGFVLFLPSSSIPTKERLRTHHASLLNTSPTRSILHFLFLFDTYDRYVPTILGLVTITPAISPAIDEYPGIVSFLVNNHPKNWNHSTLPPGDSHPTNLAALNASSDHTSLPHLQLVCFLLQVFD